MQGQLTTGTDPSSLASLRLHEDEVRLRVDAVRERLAHCVGLLAERPERGGAYRGDARAVDEKIRAAEEARGERARLRVEEAELMFELEQIRASLENRGIRHVPLPILENVSIASPCSASWADMQGESDTRFCAQCDKHVYNLSMMSRTEAEAVIATSVSDGKEMCLRLYRRADGTVLTDDCPVGVRRRRFWRRTSGIAAAGLLLAALGSVMYVQMACNAHVAESSATTGF